MSIVNVDNILNGTPEKRFFNGYNYLKENFNETSANQFYELYKDMPLSFILENSRMIFSEPYKGLQFYKESIMDDNFYSFARLEDEYDKVSTFIEENVNNMGKTQRGMYDELLSSMKEKMESTRNLRVLATYIKENIDENFEDNLIEAVSDFSNENDTVSSLFEESCNPFVFFTYAPFAIRSIGNTNLTDITESYLEACSTPSDGYDENQWRCFIEATVCCNKLKNDNLYTRAVVGSGYNKREVFEYFMNNDLTDTLNQVFEEKVDPRDIAITDPILAVNSLFLDQSEAFHESDNFETEKIYKDIYKSIAYEETMNILTQEYEMVESTNDTAIGYSLLHNQVTVEDAYRIINESYVPLAESYDEYIEYLEAKKEDSDDVNDDEISDVENDINDNDSKEVTAGKKPIAPKPKNFATNIQNKFMDKEANHMQKKAIRKQKGQERFNALKAVTKAPVQLVKNIKDSISKLDRMDEQRRKSYMTKPGFRKKIFRNLRLAIMYGTAATHKLSMVPVLAVVRHFSKEKDVRLRNELEREILTNIHVCDEKIEVAKSQGDNAQLYRLIRIKDQLEAERIRVKTNSKYI